MTNRHALLTPFTLGYGLGLLHDEIGHRTGPRKKRTLYIADARQATGQLITELQIGQRMLGIIESSARYAQAMEAAARQRQQSYDDG